MTTPKLHIEQIERDAFDTWAIRFFGDNKTFMDLIGYFHREGVEHTRWDSDAFDGKGAWIVDDSVLVRYADWFDNLKVQLNITLKDKKEDIPTPKAQPLATGDRVHHRLYGIRTVQPNTEKVDVQFDQHGLKHLSMDYARLEKLEDPGQ